MKILVAEDDDVSRLLTVKAVTQLGYECVVAEDGDAAWAMYHDEGADTIISDWLMPGLDGIELCRRIRNAEPHQYTYFIILTALNEHAHRLEGMQAGADDFLHKPLNRGDLQLRLIAAERVTELHRTLRQQARELQRLNHELFESGRLDALTGIANRLRMEEDLGKLSAELARLSGHVSLALFDIDHFKRYNDSAGHPAGDDVLRDVATTLAGACRAGDVLYRYGGEEFLAILRTGSLARAGNAIDRIRRAVATRAIPHPDSPTSPYVTLSAGVATLGPAGVDDALSRADAALLQAKARGRDQVMVHNGTRIEPVGVMPDAWTG